MLAGGWGEAVVLEQVASTKYNSCKLTQPPPLKLTNKHIISFLMSLFKRNVHCLEFFPFFLSFFFTVKMWDM